MLRIGDQVRVIGTNDVGTLTDIIEDMTIVKFQTDKGKFPLNSLIKVEPVKSVTAAQYDTAVNCLMDELAKEAGTSSDEALTAIGLVCDQLKRILFDGN